MLDQSARCIIMVRPLGFQSNGETANDNDFQNPNDKSHEIIATEACKEFDTMVEQLRSHAIQVHVLQPLAPHLTPDAVFPNNWFSVTHDGRLTLFPMAHKSRRLEVRPDFEHELRDLRLDIRETLDLTHFAQSNQYLEGTGSLVLDHPNKIAYMARSIRSNEALAREFCENIRYKLVCFNSIALRENVIYHTNVLLSILSDHIVFCADVVEKVDREPLRKLLESCGRNLIEIDQGQLFAFAANILEVKNIHGNRHIIMSQKAKSAFNDTQIGQLSSDTNLVISDLSTIEKYGGGSARCMIAEVFAAQL